MVAACGLGTGLYAWRWEPHWLEIGERRLSILFLPDRLVGARLVQMSDLHIGPRVDDAYLLRTFDRVIRLRPEIVVYTGDFTDCRLDSGAHVERVFPHLPLGSRATCGILGNHDYGRAWADLRHAERIAEAARGAGVRVLRNEMVEVDGLQIVGLDDLWARRFLPERALADVDQDAAAIALSHNPDRADLPVWGSYSGWILAGHTHGGQCKPPFLPPPVLPVKNRRYTSGQLELTEDRRMYISRGIGHTLEVRFNVRPELTVFLLERA